MNECPFCNPKKKDWQSQGFFGYKCGDCNQSTAFIVSSEHRGKLTEDEKEVVEKLCKKHYPDLKLRWISEKRSSMSHFYDFLVPINK